MRHQFFGLFTIFLAGCAGGGQRGAEPPVELKMQASGDGPGAGKPAEEPSTQARPAAARADVPGAPVALNRRTLSSARTLSCFVARSGEVRCWGEAMPKFLEGLPKDVRFVELGEHCMLDANSHVWCPNPAWTEETNLSGANNVSARCVTSEAGGIQCAPLSPSGFITHQILSKDGRYADLDGTVALTADGKLDNFAMPIGKWRMFPEETFVAIRGSCHLSVRGVISCREHERRMGLERLKVNNFVRLYSGPPGSACGRLSNGDYTCWGAWNDLKFPAEDFSEVEFSEVHACGVRAKDSRVLCWGYKPALAANPPSEVGEYLAEPSFPIGSPGVGTSAGPATLPEMHLQLDASCKKVPLTELPSDLQPRALKAAQLARDYTKPLAYPGVELTQQNPDQPAVWRCKDWYEVSSSHVSTNRLADRGQRADLRVRFGSAQAMAAKFGAEGTGVPAYDPNARPIDYMYKSWTMTASADAMSARGWGKQPAVVWHRHGGDGNNPHRWTWSGATFPVSPTVLVDLEVSGLNPLESAGHGGRVQQMFGSL